MSASGEPAKRAGSLVGVLPLLKPPGPSSHQVVAAVRRLVGDGTRVGHGGTLDPGAAGVLPICLGAATRLSQYLHIPAKTYAFELILGVATDTQDLFGRVMMRQQARADADQVRAVLAGLIGELTLPVPLYSARRYRGQHLYGYAREAADLGEDAPPAPPLPQASTRIESLELEHFACGQPQRAQCTVRCGSGTYVRALCVEMGRRLDLPACMGALVRTSAGGISGEIASTLEEVQAHGALADAVLSPAYALGFLPAVELDAGEVAAVRQGRAPGRRPAGPRDRSGLVRLLAADGTLVAVARRDLVRPPGSPRRVCAIAGFSLQTVLATAAS